MGFKYAWIVPILSIIVPITFIITYFVAVYNGHVASIFPYISDTAALPPESCIFAQLINMGALFGCVTVYLRQRQLKEVQLVFQEARQPWVSRLNSMMTWAGYTACFGLSLVANFQEGNVPMVHYIGALMAFVSGLIYGFGQTLLSYVVDRFIVTMCMAHLRFFLCIMATLCFGLMFSHNMIGEDLNRHSALPFIHRTVNETDEAYDWYLVSAFSEWGLGFATVLFFITFAAEFKKIIFHPPRIFLHDQFLTADGKKSGLRQSLKKPVVAENQYSNYVTPTTAEKVDLGGPETTGYQNQLREGRVNKYSEIRLPRVNYVSYGDRNPNYYNAMTIGPSFGHQMDRTSRYYRSFDQTEPAYTSFQMANRPTRRGGGIAPQRFNEQWFSE